MDTRDTHNNPSVESEQLRMLYDQAPGALAGEFILASFVAWVVGFELPRADMLLWWLAIMAVALVDFLGYVAYRRDPEALQHYRRWHRLFSVSVIIVSLFWGLAFVYLMTRVGPEYQLFLALLLACLGGGSVAALAPRSSLLACNLGFSMLPSVLWLLLQGSLLGMAAGFVLIALALELWFGGRDLGQQILQSLKLRFENEHLVDELQRSNVSLQEKSHTDSLTGLHNRRFFDEALHNEFARMHRETGPLGLVLLDVDYFKAYNDRLGHQAGDECLRRVAATIREAVNRPADVVARFGGEEFVVLLPETDPAGARAVAERIRHALRVLALPHPDAATGTLTVSMGVCSRDPAEGGDPDQLLVQADQAMYRAKANGRDRIEMAEPDGSESRSVLQAK